MQKVRIIAKEKKFWIYAGFLLLNTVLAHHALFAASLKERMIVIGLLNIAELIIILLLEKGQNKGFALEKIFLLAVIPLGVLFVAAMPCGESPDDLTHYYRIYGITDGMIDVPADGENANGSLVPTDARRGFFINPAPGNYSRIKEALFLRYGSNKEFVAYPASAIYNPICYFPQVIGVMIGKIFRNAVIEAYLARLLNFGFFVYLVYLAIRITPIGKKTVFLLALLPSSLQEATSLSPDALTIGLSIYFISLVLSIRTRENKITKKELITLGVAAIVLSLCKIVYAPIILVMLIIPPKKFGGRKSKILKLIAILFVAAVVNGIWLYFAGRHLTEIREGVNGVEQVKFILGHPISYVRILVSSIAVNSRFYLVSGLGGLLGPLAIELPEIYILILYPLVVYTIYRDSRSVGIKMEEALVFWGVILCVMVLIFTALYIQWTPVRGQTIEGVQGRYLLPLVPLLPAAFGSVKKTKIKRRAATRLFVPYVMVFVDMCAVAYVVAANL